MVSFPPCKINLGLHVTRKRTDGYHELETCFYPVPWTDIVEVIKSNAFAFSASGTPIPGDAGQNLCIKAYEVLKKEYDLPPVSIHLHKIIPTGAGLGGGSSDAAYVLRSLNSIFRLNLSQDVLMRFASMLGSDCAFFVQDEPMFGTGRGEILSKISVSLKDRYIVLVKPDIHVSTADAYAGIQPVVPEKSLSEIISGPLHTWRDSLKNDFEPSVFSRHPGLKEIKEELYASGALYASMSGSGSTVFGLFDKEINLKDRFKGMTVWSDLLRQ